MSTTKVSTAKELNSQERIIRAATVYALTGSMIATSEQYQLGYVSGIAAAIAVCDDYGTREAQMISKTLGDMTPNVQIEGQAASGQSRSNAGLRVNTTE